MLDHEMQPVAKCLRGLLHYLGNGEPHYRIPAVTLRNDKDRERDNRKQARCMACASVEPEPTIGVCAALGALPKPFIAGVLLHELTHIAFNLRGSPEAEVDVDTTIAALVPEAGYRYGNVTYLDRKRGRRRTAHNLQRVDAPFADFCFGLWADQCPPERVIIR